jgi:hypothetical protein
MKNMLRERERERQSTTKNLAAKTTPNKPYMNHILSNNY